MKSCLITLIIAFFYAILATYLMNPGLVIDTFVGNYTLMYKIKLLTALAYGMWTSMSVQALFILFLTALLAGANLAFLIQRIHFLTKAGSLHIMAGGSSLISLATSGCASCGLPILSLLGLTGILAYLPFHGYEVSYISLSLLLISLYFLIKTNSKVCKIK